MLEHALAPEPGLVAGPPGPRDAAPMSGTAADPSAASIRLQQLTALADAGRYGDIFLIAAVVVVLLSVAATWRRAAWRGPEEDLR